MQDETKLWLDYAEENLNSAKVLLESEFYNTCIYNIQQVIEKSLKSLFIEYNLPFKKTHNILELKIKLQNSRIEINITDEECEFFDSIYLPAKYPLGSALPSFYPDRKICEDSLILAKRIFDDVRNLIYQKPALP